METKSTPTEWLTWLKDVGYICKWIEVSEWDDVYWETSCDNSFILLDGTLETSGMKYCPFCGKLIEG